MKKPWNYLKKLESTGIYPSVSYLDSKKVRMLNLIALTCIPLTFMFFCINLKDGRLLLSAINFSNCITAISVLILHHYRCYAAARFVLIVFNFLLFFLGSYLFKNGGEFFLFSVLIVTLLVYDRLWIHIFAGILIPLSMFIVTLYPSQLFLDQYVPLQRAVFNGVTAVIFIVVFILFFKNIQYNYQDKIEEQHKKLKDMNSTMESIFSIIAHDIRSPLTSVQNMLTLFQKDIITKYTANENITVLNNRISHLNEALDNLLRWGSRNIHGLQTRRNDVFIADIIQEVLQLLTPQINQKEIKLKREIDNTLIAHIDGDQINVVLRNIISNAIKYSFFGESIFISAKEVEGKAIIEIKDRGIGMTKDKLDQLFSSLQIPTFGTGGERGSGVGLLLCKELLSQNNGDFQIKSQPNVGSAFTISLPTKNHKQVRETVCLQ